jgi:hypothetical protein
MKMFSLEKFAERLLNLMVEHGDSTYSPACSPPPQGVGRMSAQKRTDRMCSPVGPGSQKEVRMKMYNHCMKWPTRQGGSL